jgi:hypothetical protein
MRYTVRVEKRPAPVEFEFGDAAQAVSKAWSLMSSGATSLYVYDNETCEAFFPGEFAGLFKSRAPQLDANPVVN